MDILLLERLAPEAQAWLEARHRVACRPDLAAEPGTLRKAVSKARAVVLPRKVVVTQQFLDAAPLLQAVGRMHGGTDNTDLEACRERNVRVIQASNANVRSNAEYLLASLLLLCRPGIGSALGGDRHAEVRLGRELNGSVVGLLGLAPAAHALALMLHTLGAKVLAYDPAVHHTAPLWSRLPAKPVSLQDLMAQSDAISVQVIYGSRYQGFINDKLLANCRQGQLWVGVSRSQLFDGDALARALADGRIAACMLDGAETGFASRGTLLHEASNLFLTPRLGSQTREARLRGSWYLAHRLHETLASPSANPTEQFASGAMALEQNLSEQVMAPPGASDHFNR